MSKIMNTILITVGSGYFTAWMGILTGILFSFFIKNRGRRFKGTVIGFVGGLMVSAQ